MGLSGSQSELFNNTLNEISNSAGTVNEKLMDVTSTQEFQSRVRDQFINKLDREIGKEMQWIDATEKMNEIYQKSGGWMGKLPIPALQAVGSLQGMNKIQELLNSSSETYNSFVDETKQELETQYVTDFAGELERLSDIGSSNALLMERLRARIGEYKQDVIDLTRQLDKLNSTQSMKESLRYIPLALKATGDELQKYGYLNKIADEQTRSLVDSIRLQKQELDDLQQVNESYSRSMQTNNIRLMEIELKSMKHRGRLTRNQKEEMNELKQENLEYRISQAKNQQEINSIKQGELREDENVLASKQRMLKEEIYLINDNYNEQVNTLQRSINYRKLLINEHTTDMQTAQQQSLDAWQTYYDNVLLATQDWSEDMKNEFKKVAGYTLASGSSSAINAISSIKYGSSPGTGSSLGDALSSGNLKDLFVGDYAVGTSYVPRDGLAMVHRGETINRNNDASGDRNININFNGNIRVEDGRTDDITSLTQKVSQAVRAGLMSGASTVYD
jgi:hypothetical protein